MQVVFAPRLTGSTEGFSVAGLGYGADNCPNSVSIGHWQNNPPDTGISGTHLAKVEDGLHKDYVGRLFHQEARDLAIAQTQKEWCRLVNLIGERYPNGGIKTLFDKWVFDPAKAQGVCNTNVAVALIIDETGSMATNDPGRRRVDAAKTFIDAAQQGDRIAVIAFGQDYRVLAPLTTIVSDTTKSNLKTAVDGILANGGTDLNAGLEGGFAELSKANLPNSVALFLTDGKQDCGGGCIYLNQSHEQYADRQWPIYTIGLGISVDTPLLKRIADKTEGTYTALRSANDLISIYAEISQRIAQANMLFRTSVKMMQGANQRFAIIIPKGQTTASFFTTWPGSEVSTKLISPTGVQIEPATQSWDVFHAKGAVYQIYKISYPEPGNWTIDLVGTQLAPAGEQVTVQVFSQGRTMLYLPFITRNSQ